MEVKLLIYLLYYTILYYTMICYAMLCYTILYYAILYYAILYYTILFHYLMCEGSIQSMDMIDNLETHSKSLKYTIGKLKEA